MTDPSKNFSTRRFGIFELVEESGRLYKGSRPVRLQPQPFKLLCLLTEKAGQVVTRDDIRAALWTSDTHVDFDQGVNYAIKQVREVLGEDAENPVFIETIPKRGYRFMVPVEIVGSPALEIDQARTDPVLRKALWENIAELRLAELQRQKQQRLVIAGVIGLAIVAVVWLLLSKFGSW